MKKIVCIAFSIVTLVALGEGIFIFTKLRKPAPIKSRQVQVKSIEKNTSKAEVKSEPETEESSQKRTYAIGENGMPLRSVNNTWGTLTYYAYNMSILTDEHVGLFEFCYKTVYDCARMIHAKPIPNETKFVITDYIYGENSGSEFGCFKARTSDGGYVYLPYDDKVEAVELWKKSEIKKLNGTEYKFFDFEGGAWYRDSMPVYEEPYQDSKVAFIYDYSKLDISRGDELYCPAIEAAIAINSNTYWLKIETPLGTGWVPESEGNVERGGPVYHFPESDFEFRMSPP